MVKKLHIMDSQFGILGESEWNFHVGKGHDMRPYVSDNKFQMFGRETGHFGSGTYFCTYRGSEFRDKYIKDSDSEYYGDYERYRGHISKGYDEGKQRNMNPNFIQVGDGIYRVDFDLYKNLYRVSSKRQGDVLFTMMHKLNAFYNRIVDMGKFNPKRANYDNSGTYQEIRANAFALGLECPSYYELTRMAQRHEGLQSFSTLFMEWNGFNGVNVSGIDYYDNTKHGSVIYDLSKVSDEMREVNPRNLFTIDNSSYNDTVVYDSTRDYAMGALRGSDMFWYDKLNEMPIDEALRILKNYTLSGHILHPFSMSEMDDELLKRYLRILFSKDPRDSWGDKVCDKMFNYSERGWRYYVRLIEKVGAYYWVNYSTKKGSGLIALLDNYEYDLDWGYDDAEVKKLKKEYYDKLMTYMQRDLTSYEKEWIKEEYFDEEDNNE